MSSFSKIPRNIKYNSKKAGKSKASKIAIIAGSGVLGLLFTKGFKNKVVKTEYGRVSIKQGKISGKTITFLNRHGEKYEAPSHINYRANIAALKTEGVDKIIATAAVGAINPRLKPADFVLLSDFIDFTRKRTETFNEKSFIDVSSPYNASLIEKIKKAAQKIGIKLHRGVTYVCTEGPRFETRAEIKLFAKLGGDVVGMTQVPEVVLAAEANIPYAAVAIVTNYAAGLSRKIVSAKEVMEVMAQRKKELSLLLESVINSL